MTKEGFPEEQIIKLSADGERFTKQRNTRGEGACRTEAAACAKAPRREKS